MPKNTDKQINVRMSYELYIASKGLSDKAGWTLAAWIRKAMEEKVNRDAGISAEPNAAVTRAEIRKIIQEEIRASTMKKGIPPLQRL